MRDVDRNLDVLLIYKSSIPTNKVKVPYFSVDHHFPVHQHHVPHENIIYILDVIFRAIVAIGGVES